jgi:hypothetical protein
MIPDAFTSTYPQLGAMLTAIKDQDAGSGVPGETGEALELSAVCSDEGDFVELLSGIFGGPPRPDEEFMRFSMSAYHRLRASDLSRTFLGRIWADAAQGWGSQDRARFLTLLVRDPYEVFEVLDIAAELFRRVQFTAEEILPWIPEAHGRVVNDIYQKGSTCKA